jgi:ribose/xylose/arabinose/galactoside ABC-type transport system permease subunit
MKGNFAAIVLIVLGAFFLLTNLGLINVSLAELLKTWWPLILIALGVTMIIKRTDNK